MECSRIVVCRPARRKLKIQFLINILKRYDIVIIQELHGDEHDLQRYSQQFCNLIYLHSPGPDNGTGGVATFVRNRIISLLNSPPQLSDVVPGRFSRLNLTFSIDFLETQNLASLKIYSLHDEHLPQVASLIALYGFRNGCNICWVS